MGQNTAVQMTKERVKEILYANLKNKMRETEQAPPAILGIFIEALQDDLADDGISMEESRAIVEFIKNDPD